MNKVADRENVYEGIRSPATQVLAAFDASGAAENKVDDMKTDQRQVHGAKGAGLDAFRLCRSMCRRSSASPAAGLIVSRHAAGRHSRKNHL